MAATDWLAQGTLVLASNNKGKIAEFETLFAQLDLPVQVIPQGQLNIEDAVEDGLSFVENAILKARHAAKISGKPAIADDSGLCVDALNGRPGVYSARYSGEDGNSERNIDKVLGELADIHEDDKRSAKFVSVVSIAYPNGKIKSYRGEVEGRILNERDGKNGFGYDSIFYSTDLKKSFGQATPDEKKQVSHRARAFAQLRKEELEK
mgnify:CR=1 FL=1